VLSVGQPTEVTALQGEDITQITAAGDVSAVVTSTGQIYTFGRTKVIDLFVYLMLGWKSWR
jgi:alpha-tubulin suppressor-like RCC1 family protein